MVRIKYLSADDMLIKIPYIPDSCVIAIKNTYYCAALINTSHYEKV